ncbi:MAG TPA: translocation/assembly module TamB domain-containing protein, partial [Gemmatimonadales bacterium]|nr:translocation/assembly module TamB domain-containing protein [Gemmatimonadales bacterium]
SADSGNLRLDARGFSLAPFDSLVRAGLGLSDTLAYRPLSGTGQFAFAVAGSLDRLAIDGTLSADSVMIDDWRISTLSASVAADSLPTGVFRMDATIDSLGKGRRSGTGIEFGVDMMGDSTAVAVSGTLDRSQLAMAGWRSRNAGTERFGLERMSLTLPRQEWKLTAPAMAAMTDRVITLEDTLALTTVDGSGLVTVSGDVPGLGPGGMEISVVGLQLADLYALLGRDTAAVGGLAQLDMRLGGTRNSPTLRGNLIVTGPRFRDASPPLLRGSYDYRDRILQGNLAFWRLGEPVLEIDARLPFDLALAAREQRRLPGPIEIRAFADSADLSILEAFTTSMQETTGAMSLDLGITGTWASPRLEGSAQVHQGRTSIPALGVRYGPIQGSADFAGDSMIVNGLTLASSEGELQVDGSVRFEDLSRANLNLGLTSRRFLAINVPGFLVVRPTGTVSLTGPITRPVLRGSLVRITESDIYFADIISKNVLDLEDPFYRGLLDLEEVRRQRLGAAFQNRFIDSLRIESLRVIVGPDVWLRSAEAEIQLEGEAQVSKTGRDYLVAGTLNTPRGEYTIDMRGLIRRKFTIDHGTVTYLGTPDLDANLNIQASYRVRAYDGEEIPVVAQITGSILVPEVTLTSPGRNLSQMDLVTYLMFGRLDFQLAGQGGAGGNLAALALITAMTRELERQVVQETQIGLDLFELRPGLSNGPGDAGTFTRLAAGRQLGPRWFVTVNAGLCLGGQQQSISARNFGATIEYRVTREWRLQGTAEPVQSCLSSTFSNAFSNIARRYQLGLDLLWQRDY